jgi:hypothetical protein
MTPRFLVDGSAFENAAGDELLQSGGQQVP